MESGGVATSFTVERKMWLSLSTFYLRIQNLPGAHTYDMNVLSRTRPPARSASPAGRGRFNSKGVPVVARAACRRSRRKAMFQATRGDGMGMGPRDVSISGPQPIRSAGVFLYGA